MRGMKIYTCKCGYNSPTDQLMERHFDYYHQDDRQNHFLVKETKTMTLEQFNKFQLQLLDKVIKTMAVKGEEYANSEIDRFGNFNRLSARLGIKNTQVALVYLTKHMDAIEHYIKAIKKGEVNTLQESIEGRFIDAIAYLLLIAGMVEEEQ